MRVAKTCKRPRENTEKSQLISSILLLKYQAVKGLKTQ